MAVRKEKAAPSGDDTGDGKRNKHTDSIAKAQRKSKAESGCSLGLYEIRRNGTALCAGHCLNLGYSKECLKDMARNGMHLYFEGKRVKL